MKNSVLGILLILSSTVCAQEKLHFDHLNIPTGAYDILQDQQGFLWFTTGQGLVRYDGYEFKSFLSSTQDSTSFQGEGITALIEDQLGYLWVGTHTGRLYRYDPVTQLFKFYDPDPDEPTALKGHLVHDILEDSKKRLWVTTFGGGLYLYQRDTDEFYNFFFNTDSNDFWINDIIRVFEADTSTLWLETNGGLLSFDIKSEEITVLDNYPHYAFGDHNHPRHFFKDRREQIWASGYGMNRVDPKQADYIPVKINGSATPSIFAIPVAENDEDKIFTLSDQGLGIFDQRTNTFVLNAHKPADPYSLSKGTAYQLLVDNSGIIWVQVGEGSIDVHYPSRTVTHHTDYFKRKDLSTNLTVSAIHIDDSANVWIGTVDQGLIKYDRRTQICSHFNFNLNEGKWFGGDTAKRITSIYQDKFGILWIGTMWAGLYKLDPVSGNWKNYYLKDKGRGVWGSTTLDRITVIYEDSHGNLWVGHKGSGVSRMTFDNSSGYSREFVSYHGMGHDVTNERSLSTYAVNVVHQDKYNNLWVGTDRGLNLYNSSSDFERFLMTNQILTMVSDRKNRLWVGTWNGFFKAHGLNRAAGDSIWFEKIDLSEEHSGKPMLVFGEDQSGYLWLVSADQSIFKYHPETRAYKLYEEEDGVRMGLLKSGHFSNKGELAVGGSNGFVTIDTKNLKSNLFIPPVVISDFLLSNKIVTLEDSINGKPVLTKVVNHTKKITLPYGKNFGFSFAALNFASPGKNRYSYKLEGFDEDWSPPSTSRMASFTNIWEGDYTFRVKGSNNDGVWNEQGASIAIKILPPWYRSKIAYIIYGGLLLSAVFLARRNLINRERAKAKRQIERMELEKTKEMDNLKSQFFTNISHEFRTPLTLILGPLRQMKEGAFKGDVDAVINVMIRNSSRLLSLINQLLDFSKLEAGGVSLQASVGDLVEFVRTMFATFESSAQSRNIKYVFQSDVSTLPAYYDRDKLEKVLINLISNAFKFTKDHGSIKLTMSRSIEDKEVDKGEGAVEILIEDNGKGISAKELPHIFDRFYQVDASSTRQQEGTGIGLALAKELVKLHHGTIKAQSKKGEGTTFKIRLPMGRSHLKDEQVVVRKGYQPIDITALQSLPEAATIPLDEDKIAGDLPILLIVDDNEDMRLYLKEVLSVSYQIAEASNGVRGWEFATEHIPDLVISDVMMPEMDGHEFCHKIKHDERTSHIPVVLLTARAGEQAKLEGLSTGADDYLTKPFSPAELRARVQNLIELRQKLREQYSSSLSLEPKDITVTSADEQFLQRSMDIMEVHRSDPEFNAEAFIREIGISRSQLHRKLKALTDQSASEFIRTYRLKYARQLIGKSFGNMTQIAYESGFNNPSYFAECFKKQFGISPSEFARSMSKTE